MILPGTIKRKTTDRLAGIGLETVGAGSRPDKTRQVEWYRAWLSDTASAFDTLVGQQVAIDVWRHLFCACSFQEGKERPILLTTNFLVLDF
jgi:hypothetical protein